MVLERHLQLQAPGRPRPQGSGRLRCSAHDPRRYEVRRPRYLPHLALRQDRKGLGEGRSQHPQHRRPGRDRRQQKINPYRQTQKGPGSQLRSPGLFACLRDAYFFFAAVFFAAFFTVFFAAFLAGAFFAAAFFAGAFFAAFLVAKVIPLFIDFLVLFFTATFLGVAFFAATFLGVALPPRRALTFFAADFDVATFFAITFFATLFLPAVFSAAAFLATTFFAAGLLTGLAFFATDFFGVTFLAGVVFFTGAAAFLAS